MLTSSTRIPRRRTKARKKQLLPRKQPVQRRAADTVRAILDAAAHIVVTRGYVKTTTNHIAEKAGISIGSLYQHFPSKDAIVSALLDQLIEQERVMIEKVVHETRGASTEVVVRGIIGATFDFFEEKKDLRRALFEQTPEYIKRDRTHYMMKKLSRIILEGVQQSHGKPNRASTSLDVYLIVNAIEAALRAAVYRFGHRIKREQMLDVITDLVLRYLNTA